MGLYQPAKKLRMTRQDLGYIILRPGELRIVMAQLRTIGAFIENSGLDMCWVESDLYGPSTVEQILGGNHVKRREAAHTVTLQALFSLYQEAYFVRHPAVRTIMEKSANQLSDACKKGDKQDITAKHEELAQTITLKELAAKMEQFDADHEDSLLFKFTRGYNGNGYGDDDVYQSRADWKLGSPFRSPTVVCEVLLCARNVKLRSHDSCLLGRDGDSKGDQS